MTPKRVVLTAGFSRALNVLAIAELLTRDGHEVASIVVVTPFSVSRLRKLVAQRGLGFPLMAARRMLGRGPAGGAGSGEGDSTPDPLADLLDRERIESRSLRAWAAEHGVAYEVVKSLNSEAAANAVTSARADGVVYGGGGILHERFIDAAGGRILNAHHGRMPEIRGMNACEWSLLLGVPPEVTVHVIDRGIDTGPILERIPVPVNPGEGIATLRSRCTALGVEGLVKNVRKITELPKTRQMVATKHTQCFVLAPAITELLESRLTRNR